MKRAEKPQKNVTLKIERRSVYLVGKSGIALRFDSETSARDFASKGGFSVETEKGKKDD